MDKEGVTNRLGDSREFGERVMSVCGEGDENVVKEQRDREERGRQSAWDRESVN